MRLVLQIAYRLRRLALRLLRIRTRGVKVMAFDEAGRLLLIRNSYGRSDVFRLPGGGIGRRERPEAAAARELREETGLEARDLRFVSRHANEAEGKRDTIDLFTARVEGPPEPDGWEVEEARFFALGALPDKVTAATKRRLAEHRGERAPDGRW